jgi:hypothetical protein
MVSFRVKSAFALRTFKIFVLVKVQFEELSNAVSFTV